LLLKFLVKLVPALVVPVTDLSDSLAGTIVSFCLNLRHDRTRLIDNRLLGLLKRLLYVRFRHLPRSMLIVFFQ
jgi:hypothetical protein